MNNESLDHEFERSDMLAFAHAVKKEFMNVTLSDRSRYLGLQLKGQLSLMPESKTKADCVVVFGHNWMEEPPIISCHAKWVRQVRDWHANAKGELCYVLKAQWAKRLKEIASRHDINGTVAYASGYLVRNTRWLLQRHLEGYRQNIKKWKWAGWANESAGTIEFLEEEARVKVGSS